MQWLLKADKMVMLFGDHHAHYTVFRFEKFYEDA